MRLSPSSPVRLPAPSPPLLLLGLVVALAVLVAPGVALSLVEVRVGDEAVDPDPVVAAPGEQVTFINEGGDTLRLIDDQGRWDSGDLAPGDSFTITFDAEGTSTFSSEDGRITGTIQVGDAPASPPPTAEPIPTAEPVPTAEPTAEPAATPTPTATPTATPTPTATEEPAPQELAATGLPAQGLALLALLALVGGVAVVRRAA